MPADAHRSTRTLREYRHGKLDPLGMLEVSDHLAACEDCRRALGEIDDGPVYEELAAAVDGTLGPAARGDLHARLAESSAAAAELEDLERFKREMAPRAERVFGPGESPSPQEPDAQKIVSPAAETWRGWNRVILAAAAAVVLLAVGWWNFAAPKPATDATRLLTDASGQRADLSTLPADLRAGVERALREGRLDAAATLAVELRPRAGKLAGAADGSAAAGFRVLGPSGVMTRAERPTLRWAPLPGATAYVVTLASRDGSDTRMSPELPAAETSWTPPAPLVSGKVYVWQVEALRGAETLAHAPAPPAAEARFQVLSAGERAKLDRVEARYGRFPLVMAVAFARAGLEEEATGEMKKLEKAHPDSPLAARLRRQAAPAVQSPSPINTKGAQ